MTRRLLLKLFGRQVNAHESRVPTDEGPLNRFAERYNRYAELLRNGVVDTAAWRHVERAWRDMTE